MCTFLCRSLDLKPEPQKLKDKSHSINIPTSMRYVTSKYSLM